MKVKLFQLSLIAAVCTLFACGEKDPCCEYSNADFSKGIFVVNEGPWGGTGTISWHNPETGETQDSLFEKANNGAVLGQFVQSLSFHNAKGYIVVNGADRVVVVDIKTFKYLDTIGGLAQPRFFLPIDNNTAYISQWGSDGLTGSVAKVNLNTNQVVKTIGSGRGPEKMVRVNDRVYVANSGGYGKDSTLTEILISNDLSQEIPLPSGINPSSLALYNQQLFYLCKGYYLDTNPMGRLDFVNGGPGVEAPASSDDLFLDEATGEMYFIGGNTIYKAIAGMPTPTLLEWQSPVVTGIQTPYSLTFDPDQNLVYCGDTRDYITAGEVFIFKTDGTKIGSFRTGILPGEIVILK
ncbi:MAG: YncE family protein [Saprospiraceae bacterium]